jgi:transcription factor C subunit 6
MQPRKLGLLAGTFQDGSLSIYVVPEPMDILPLRHDISQPVFGSSIAISLIASHL